MRIGAATLSAVVPRMTFSLSRPAPQHHGHQPHSQQRKEDQRHHVATVPWFGACNDCARLGAQKFPWPASFGSRVGPKGRHTEICSLSRGTSCKWSPTLISEPVMVSVT